MIRLSKNVGIKLMMEKLAELPILCLCLKYSMDYVNVGIRG